MKRKDTKELLKSIRDYRNKMDSSKFQLTGSSISQLEDLMAQLSDKSYYDIPLNFVLKALKSSVLNFLFESNPDLIIIKEILDMTIKVLTFELKRNREVIRIYFSRVYPLYLPRMFEKRYRFLRQLDFAIDSGVTESGLQDIFMFAPGEIQIMFKNKINRFLLGDLDVILCQEFMTPIWIAEDQQDTSNKSSLEWFINQLPSLIKDEQKKLINTYRNVYL